MEIINKILLNKDNVKFIAEVIFTIVSTVVLIATYRRAKETILQPVRTDLIKKQSTMLLDLLEKLSLLDLVTVDKAIDYQNIIELNVKTALFHYGFIGLEEYAKSLEQAAGAWCPLDEDMKPIGKFDDFDVLKQEHIDIVNEVKDKTAHTSKGAHYTSKYSQYNDALNSYINSPIIPRNVKDKLQIFQKEIEHNILVNVPEVVESLLRDLNSKRKDKQKAFKPGYNIYGLFNEFISKYKSHEKIIKNINEEIRKYLKVDSMPK